MQAAIIRGERRMLRIVDVPLSTGAVAGFAIDVQDLEDARTELARYIESQRELADRMTAGTAQFDADRTLSFFNRPFAAMAQLDPDWLAERPEFDRVIERMREKQRLPETRDFPGLDAKSGAAGSPAPTKWSKKNGCCPTATISGSSPSRCPTAACACSSRTAPSSFGWRRRATPCCGFARRPSTICSRRSACSPATAGCTCGTGRFLEDWELDEEWLATHPRVDELVPAMARKLVNPDRRRADPRDGPPDHQRARSRRAAGLR